MFFSYYLNFHMRVLFGCILFYFCLFCVFKSSVFVFHVGPTFFHHLLPELQPALRHRRSRSMSVCVPPSSFSFSHAPLPLTVPPKKPSTPPPDQSSLSSYNTSSPCMSLATERDTFAGRLSKALETVLPLHSATSLPKTRQRRASLPTLFSTPVGSQS